MKLNKFFLDTTELENPDFEFTPSGFLRVKGTIARTGTMEYLDNFGNIYYQYVPPSTLFDDDHLSTIPGLPVTLFHPDVDVNTNNYKRYAVGSVGDRVFANIDKGLLEVVFTICDAEAIKEVSQGVNQLSMGYWANLEEHPSEPRTYVQTKRIANHIALVDKARGGDSLKLQLDSYYVVTNRINKDIQKEPEIWRTLSVTI